MSLKKILNDFADGFIDTFIVTPIAFGDFLARVSGLRDWQENTIDQQKQAINEIKIVYQALTNKTSLKMLGEYLLNDLQDRPFYYLGGFITLQGTASTISNKTAQVTYKSSIYTAKADDAIHELLENNKEFYDLISKNLKNNNITIDEFTNHLDTFLNSFNNQNIDNIYNNFKKFKQTNNFEIFSQNNDKYIISQTPTFSPKNLIESEITQINEALERYGVADKERYLREIDDKMAVFNGYLDNRCDALEKFTKNSDISAASNDFDKAVKQQENLLKGELTFTEKYAIKDFAHKLYGVKMPETKQRIGIDAATQCKISFLLDTISKHKRQIVRNFGEKTWQETFENFQKTSDLKVFENALKSQNSTQNFNKNINLQIPNENANLKNPNLQNSAGNVNSENNATNLQNLDNDFKM